MEVPITMGMSRTQTTREVTSDKRPLKRKTAQIRIKRATSHRTTIIIIPPPRTIFLKKLLRIQKNSRA
jgi:hypothetical protein